MIDIQKEIERKFPSTSEKPGLFKKSLFKIAKKLIHQDAINEFLKENSHLKGLEFVDSVLDYFDFDYTVSSSDIQNIPSSGKVVIIANHPLGGLDALCLLRLVSQVRSDVKIVANDFLMAFKTLDSLLIPVNNFNSRQSKQSVKKIYEALDNEEAVIIFPAGVVSRATTKGIKDSVWSKGFLNFAKNTNAPILPILVDAKNSKTFYTISMINKTFSTILLSHEMFNKRSKRINIKIGKIISNEHIYPKGIEKKYIVNLYKKHLYALKKAKKSFFQTQSAIAHPVNRKDLVIELKKSKLIGETKDGKKIYLYDYVDDSIVLKELGRLRELSFRKVGEGINKKRDTDKYDIYYQHIILWDDKDLEIVGSYRIGNSDFIFKNIGVKGFYSNTLFKFHEEFTPYLKNSIELGRSFVQPKYWGTRALDYLWYGIGAYLKNNPQIKYMFGPVSMSASFPKTAKDMMTYYYTHYYSHKQNLVRSRLPYVYSNKFDEIKSTFNNLDKKEDFRLLKSSLQNMNCSVPTLYKQYSDIADENGVFFCDFNVDTNFSDCIDGFILVEVDKIKDSAKKRYIS